MFKFGIYKKEQLTPAKLAGFINRRKSIALDLYNSLDDLPEAESERIQEPILRWFRLHNGVLKHTHTRRFDDFDQLSFSTIAANFSSGQSLRVHDIAASDGRTSCGLYEYLNHRFGERLTFVASDAAPHLYILKRAQSANRIIIDEQQEVLQIITPPFVFIIVCPESRKLYPLNHLIRRLVTVLYVRPLLQGYNAGHPGIERIRLDLLCRRCRGYISKGKNFRFESYDVFSASQERFDIIRAMNVLNYSYFPEPQLRKAVNNIVQSLSQGGLFITGSNTAAGTVVNGGIYKKTKDGMERVEISGTGSQLDGLISGVDATLTADVGFRPV